MEFAICAMFPSVTTVQPITSAAAALIPLTLSPMELAPVMTTLTPFPILPAVARLEPSSTRVPASAVTLPTVPNARPAEFVSVAPPASH